VLVEEHLGKRVEAEAEASVLPGGAGLVIGGDSSAWVLVDDGGVGRLGATLAWAWRQNAAFLDVVVEGDLAAGLIARRAGEFARPSVRVWSVDGRRLLPAAPAAPLLSSESADPELVSLLRAHGADPVIEHGVLRGEVLGLEVARVVGDRLEVGVGLHDRSARAEMRPDEDPGGALDEAVRAVRDRRRLSAQRHPANTLARGRWLRSVVCSHPSMAGFRSLVAVAPPLPWLDLPEAGAAPAAGFDLDESPVVAVFSVGVDMDLVPTAADSRLLHSPSAALVLVVPEADDVPVTRALAESLRLPAEVRTVPAGWEALGASGP
jgi:hypothetical protein